MSPARRQTSALALSALFLMPPDSSHAQRQAHTMLPPVGAVVAARLTSELSSNNSRAGDAFTAVAQPGAQPEGTCISGTVVGARKKSGKHPGMLDFKFTGVRFASVRRYIITGSLIGLNDKSVRGGADGRLVATPDHRNSRLT